MLLDHILATKLTTLYKVDLEDDLREGFPVPHDNFLKSINSFAPCCESFIYFRSRLRHC